MDVASIIVGLIALFGAIVAYSLSQREAALERRCKACADVLADIYK